MRFRDSGSEIILDSGHGADGPKSDREHYFLETYGMTAEEAIIKHYEDFHVFLYGVVPLLVALVITYLFYKWFSDTFTR